MNATNSSQPFLIHQLSDKLAFGAEPKARFAEVNQVQIEAEPLPSRGSHFARFCCKVVCCKVGKIEPGAASTATGLFFLEGR